MLAFCFSGLNIHSCRYAFDQDGPLWSLVRALWLNFATLHLELVSEFQSRMEMVHQWRRSCSLAELVSECASTPRETWLCSVQLQPELTESCVWTLAEVSSQGAAICRALWHHQHRGPWKCSKFLIYLHRVGSSQWVYRSLSFPTFLLKQGSYPDRVEAPHPLCSVWIAQLGLSCSVRDVCDRFGSRFAWSYPWMRIYWWCKWLSVCKSRQLSRFSNSLTSS